MVRYYQLAYAGILGRHQFICHSSKKPARQTSSTLSKPAFADTSYLGAACAIAPHVPQGNLLFAAGPFSFVHLSQPCTSSQIFECTINNTNPFHDLKLNDKADPEPLALETLLSLSALKVIDVCHIGHSVRFRKVQRYEPHAPHLLATCQAA